MTKEEKLLQAIDNLEDAIAVLEAEGTWSNELRVEYYTKLGTAKADLALLRYRRRQKERKQ